MKYIVDNPLYDFPFWSGAKDNAAQLTYDELDELGNVIGELVGGPDGLPTDADINNLFWFDFPLVCKALGYDYVAGKVVRGTDEN